MPLPSSQAVERLQSQLPLPEFVRFIVAAVAGEAADIFGIMQVRGTDNRFVQLAAGADGDICGEVVGNRFLRKGQRWPPPMRRQLEELGWVPPLPASAPLPADSPSLNYRHDWRAVAEEARLAAMAELAAVLTTTLTQVMGVTSPDQLDVTLGELAHPSSAIGVRSVTPRDERIGADSRWLWAYVDERGLHIGGQHPGPATSAVSGDGEYEWSTTFAAADVPRVVALLDGQPDEDVLDVLERWAGRSYELEGRLRDCDTPH